MCIVNAAKCIHDAKAKEWTEAQSATLIMIMTDGAGEFLELGKSKAKYTSCSGNSFAADTQRAYQQLRTEIHGEKKFSLNLLLLLLEIGQDLEHIMNNRPADLDDRRGQADCRAGLIEMTDGNANARGRLGRGRRISTLCMRRATSDDPVISRLP